MSRLVSDAELFRAFRERFPNSGERGEAKRQEALLLIQAWQLGDTANASRRTELVREIRRDTSLATALRAHVAALADNVAVALRAELSPTERVAAYENTVRSLIAEFPAHPAGYESLLQIARASPPERAIVIAQDLAVMPAPAQVTGAATLLLERHSLVGRPIAPMVEPILGADNPVARAAGRSLLIYTWSSKSDLSQQAIRDAAKKLPAAVALVGLCLDERDLTKARQRAVTLPGEQLYDWLGARGEVAERLQLTEVGLIYVAGPDGNIASVTAHQNVAAALSAVNGR